MDGMAIFGAVIGGLALLGIIAAYAWGEAKTPGWGWKRQVENPNATTAEQVNEASGQPTPRPTETGYATPEEELDQAVQEASRQRQESVNR